MEKSNAELDEKIIELDLKRELEEPRPPAFSDEALALRFAELHADDLRYVAAWGKWLIVGWRALAVRRDVEAYDLVRKICRVAAGAVQQAEARLGAGQRQDRRGRRAAWLARTGGWRHGRAVGHRPLAAQHTRRRNRLAHRTSCARHRPDDYMTKITAVAPDRRMPHADLACLPRTDHRRRCRARSTSCSAWPATRSPARHESTRCFSCTAPAPTARSTFHQTITGIIGDYHTHRADRDLHRLAARAPPDRPRRAARRAPGDQRRDRGRPPLGREQDQGADRRRQDRGALHAAGFFRVHAARSSW